MLKHLPLFFFLFFTGLAFEGTAQTGKLHVGLYDYYNDSLELRFDLYSGDKLQKSSPFDFVNDLLLDSLHPGIYHADVFVNSKLSSSYYDIIIKRDSTTYLSISTDKLYFNGTDTLSDNRNENCVTLLYGPGSLMPPSKPAIPLQNVLTLGISPGFAVMFNKAYGLGCHIGTDISIAQFSRKDSTYFPSNASHARYFSWNLSFSLFQRISFFNYKSELDHGIYFDLGASYHFPLIFHYAVTQDNHKLTDSRIHQFTDFSAVARFGYAPFTVQTEYRLLDYLIGNYPEMPKLRIGLAFLIRNE